MATSTYLQNAFLNAALTDTSYTSPTTVYVALYTVSPGPGGGGTEVSGSAYVRQAITFGTPSSGAVSNSAAVVFPAATGSGWGTISYAGIFDDPTTGNLLFYGTLTTSKVINVGDQFQFVIGALTITES
jgi:hypothetical protein